MDFISNNSLETTYSTKESRFKKPSPAKSLNKLCEPYLWFSFFLQSQENCLHVCYQKTWLEPRTLALEALGALPLSHEGSPSQLNYDQNY